MTGSVSASCDTTTALFKQGFLDEFRVGLRDIPTGQARDRPPPIADGCDAVAAQCSHAARRISGAFPSPLVGEGGVDVSPRRMRGLSPRANLSRLNARRQPPHPS